MKTVFITVEPGGKILAGWEGQPLLELLQAAGIPIDAPCGGNGSCGKCTVTVDGEEVRSCEYRLSRNAAVCLPERHEAQLLEEGTAPEYAGRKVEADGENEYCVAFDVGTTTVVCFLLDGRTGDVLAQASCLNPQGAYGADVISRIEYELSHHNGRLKDDIRECLAELVQRVALDAGIHTSRITLATAVGNTAMHHLLLDYDLSPLIKPPYMPSVREALEIPADFLPLAPGAVLRVLPNIAGFVGADTVACMEAVDFDRFEKLTLLIDIGTNGEMVLGNRDRRLACSTAAGPAFEGAKIEFGMRGADGAIEHVVRDGASLRCTVIGGGTAVGICGSGLLDAVNAMLEAGLVDASGRLLRENGQRGWIIFNSQPAFELRDGILITQKDVREVQLAKAAIRAGIDLMLDELGRSVDEIDAVLIAGAFGNYLSPRSAAGIGMIPPQLLDRVRTIGNAAGEGAKRCAVSRAAFEHSKKLAEGTDFLELANLSAFQDWYIDRLCLREEE